MIQELFHIGSFSVSPFGVMLVLSFLAAYLQLQNGMRRLGIGDEEDASALVFAAGFFGILGGKIYYAMLFSDWRLVFDRAGIVWYGGLIGGALAVLWVIRRRGLPLRSTLDAAGVGMVLGHAVGRIGCFLVGDDYGVPTDRPWGVVFRNGLPPSTAGALRSQFGVEVPATIPDSQFLAVHPTQLYETLACLVIWGLTLSLLGKLRPGNVFVLAIGLLASERFLVEFLRAKDDRFLGGFTLAQLISVVVILIVALLALWWRRRPPDSAPGARARAAEPA